VKISKQLEISLRVAGMAMKNPHIIRSFLRDEWRRRWGSAVDRRRHPGRSGLPTYISLNPTRRCNLKCAMCVQYRRGQERPDNLDWYDPRRELPVAAWIRLMDELAEWRPVIFITGGEPLLYDGILDLLAAARDRGLLIHLQTNGVLLAGIAREVVSLGVSMVTVSFDGPADVHDQVRGVGGSFAKSAEGVRMLIEARRTLRQPGPLVDIRCTISKDNLSSLEPMASVACDLGVDFLHFTHTLFLTPAMAGRHNEVLSPAFAEAKGLRLVPPSIPAGEFYESEIALEHIPTLLAGMRAVRRAARGRIPVNFTPALPESLVAPYYLDLSHPFPDVCNGLWRTCRIMPDGSVSLCLHLVAGNITQSSLRELWNNTPMQRQRELMAKRLLPGCLRCCRRRFV